MITTKFQIVLIIAAIIYFLLLIKLLKDRVIIMKYALLWILTGLTLLLLALFPESLRFFADLLGIYSDTNFLFVAIISFLLMISISLTHIVSRLNEENKNHTQEIAIIEERLRKVEKKMEKDEE